MILHECIREVHWIDGDISDTCLLGEAMENTDAVIHTAGKVSFDEKDRAELFNTNVEGTANIVNAALENNIRRFIHVSSVASLGKRDNGSIVKKVISSYKCTVKLLFSFYQTSISTLFLLLLPSISVQQPSSSLLFFQLHTMD